MDKNEILSLIGSLVDDSQVAVLATVDPDGKPSMRWMTPAIISGRPASLFAVTAPNFRKVVHLKKNADVEWMIQTRDLKRVVNITGRVNVVDNPSLKSEVLESIGKRLEIFWRVNRKTDFLVLETVITEATFFEPLAKKKETVPVR